MPSTKDQHFDFLTHLPVKASDRTLLALKGHVLIEGRFAPIFIGESPTSSG